MFSYYKSFQEDMIQGLSQEFETEGATCQLVLRTSKSTGDGGDVQNFDGCQAPVLTQAL